jgi:hypothetical protein
MPSASGRKSTATPPSNFQFNSVSLNFAAIPIAAKQVDFHFIDRRDTKRIVYVRVP